LTDGIGDVTLSAGVSLFLDAGNVTGAVFLFQIDGSLIVETGADMVLVNSADTNSIFWQISGAVTFQSSSTSLGTFLVNGGISMSSAAWVKGRVFSLTAGISLTDSAISFVRSTAPPTSFPSSMPSVNYLDYESTGIYQEYIDVQSNSLAPTNYTFDYSVFSYKSQVVDSTCTSWSNFATDDITLPFDDLYYSRLVAYMQYDDFTSGNSVNVTANCSDAEKLSVFVGYLQLAMSGRRNGASEIIGETKCGGVDDNDRWKVFTCNGNVIMCVNCNFNANTMCSTGCPCKVAFVVSPCMDSNDATGLDCAYSNSATSAVLQLSYDEKILYPEYLYPVSVVVGNYDIAVTLTNVTLAGTIYCAALEENYDLTSSQTVKSRGYSTAVYTAGVESLVITISGLAPVTKYDVYCYSEDFSTHSMPIDVVLASKVTATTECCRSLLFDSSYTTILEYDESISSSESVFSFYLDSTPEISTTVSVAVVPITCTSGFLQTSVPAALPDSFVFTSTSSSLYASYIVRGSPGCYTVNLTSSDAAGSGSIVTGELYGHIEVPLLTIRSLTSPPDPPELTLAQFSNDGRYIYITMDSATDMGASAGIPNYSRTFDCSYLLQVNGNSITDGSVCQWPNSSMVQMSESTAEMYDSISLVLNTLEPACPSTTTDCSAYPLNANTSNPVTLAAPASPIKPTASVSTASSIGGCDDIVLDPTLSVGSGGRAWSSVVWTVAGGGLVDDIMTLLNGDGTTGSLQTIPRDMLDSGSVSFSLQLTNFLGGTSLTQATVTRTSNDATPTISIVGGSLVSIYRKDAIGIVASAVVPTCAGDVGKKLLYSWKVYSYSFINPCIYFP